MNTRILATIATAGLGFAASNAFAQELEWETTLGVESEYVFRGVEIAAESFQGSIDATYGDAYFGIWANEPLNSEDSNTSEYDFYAGWGYAVNDTVTADAGFTVYHYPDFSSSDNTFEAYLGLNLDAVAAPALYVYYDFDLKNLTLEGSLSHAFEIDEKTAIEVGVAGGWVDPENNAADEYYYYHATADYVYQINPSSSARIGVRAGGNDNHLGQDGREHNAWLGASYNASF